MKLLSLQLINFKCFSNHTVNFRETTIIIGENNAGKSTIIDAIRILGLACARLKGTIIYINRPEWLKDIKPFLSTKGIKISSQAIDVELESIFHRYNEPPAIIYANFDSKLKIEIFIRNENEIFTILYLNNKNITSKKKATEAGIPDIGVLPQITPLIKDEPFVNENTLNRNKFSKRTSRNFRSSLQIQKIKNPDIYNKFELLISQTWNGIKINEIEINNNFVILHLRDRDFVTEIYHMGHGVQMWLQTMWFIANMSGNSIIVLDEPDVYMHADLQRKLIRLLKGQYSQTIIATHSVEIMAEVQPNNILIINRKENESIFADKYPVLQTAIESMGSIHNISLSRILNNKKYLFVEGDDDKGILNIFYDTIFPEEAVPLDHIASSTGGWGSWKLQKETINSLIMQLHDLKIYVLYDKDFHTEQEIINRKSEAKSRQINLMILNKKEIENYLVKHSAIARLINKKNKQLEVDKLTKVLSELIEQICEDLKEETLDNFIEEARKTTQYKKETIPTIKNQLKPRFIENWSTFDGKVGLVSGKELLSKISNECKTRYGVSFGRMEIASNIKKNEIDNEIINFLTAIKYGEKINI